ncbi:thiaminase II [Thermoproteus tenax]|uniref:Transcriptional activator TenA n=1 Tax=Thermoproteus tenax (strain ATCC 35583 / DSM 2078 / JCM 9277 / NBRC 100435 / Kra 1) TaxID=768679 RepID=G4RN57_THETK|nr:thiaminase II [Thermoproteus tenax]CCC81001.1 transcriptional activator TenA [Thermoproteus tenax Kra 1]
MSLTERLRESSEDVWRAILEHPFVVSLYRGDLPLEKFKGYLLQDYNYLVGFARALALAAARAPDVASMKAMLELAHGELTGEMANYESLLRELGLTLEDAIRTRPNPTNVAYMSYLSSVCSLGSFAQCLSALLPCFWTYEAIAERHAGLLASNPVPLYKRWASVYLSSEYKALVRRLRELLESLSPRLEEVAGPFRTASVYELMFWEAAHSGESWPA